MARAADGLSLSLMLTLSFGTGILDAATYLGLHGVFTANMTGNVVFVGLGLADADSVPLLRASLALAGFVLGATVVGIVQRRRVVVDRDRDTIAAVTFLMTGLLIGACALVLRSEDHSVLVLDLFTGLLALAMGAQAVAARRVGVGDVSTVVVTSTLAGLAAEAPWTGASAGGAATMRRFGAVATMGAGAITGAFLLRGGIALPVAVTAGLLVLVSGVVLTRVIRDRPASRDVIRSGA